MKKTDGWLNGQKQCLKKIDGWQDEQEKIEGWLEGQKNG